MRHLRARLQQPAKCLLSQPRPQSSTVPSSTPILHRTVPNRLFNSTPTRASHIGSAPLSIPPSVSFSILPPKDAVVTRSGRAAPMPTVVVKGPLGELRMPVPNYVQIAHDEEARKAVISIENKLDKQQRAMWGTTRAYLANHILGVSEGHSCVLRLVGVGYRATIEPKAVTKKPLFPGQMFVNLKAGYSHPIELGVPQGVTASTPQPTRILLQGHEKEVIKSFAAAIRKWRVPEPYKGKGIFVDDETITLKAKKIK